MDRRTFIKKASLAGALGILLPLRPKWAKAFIKDIAGIPAAIPELDFCEWVKGAINRHSKYVGECEMIETLRGGGLDERIIRGLVRKGTERKSFAFVCPLNPDADMRNKFAKDLLRQLQISWALP